MTDDIPAAGTEALDQRAIDPDMAYRHLHEIERVNAWFGGRAAACFGIEWLLDRAGPLRTVTVLDLGAGMGDIAIRLRDHLGPARDVQIRPIALDHVRVAAQMCRRRALPAVVGDLRSLPFGDASADIVVVSQVLHHLRRRELAGVVQLLCRLARIGVVVADLRPSPTAVAGIWLLSHVVGFHPLTCRDGIVSVRRGFRLTELERVFAVVGGSVYACYRPGFRVVAVWEASGVHG